MLEELCELLVTDAVQTETRLLIQSEIDRTQMQRERVEEFIQDKMREAMRRRYPERSYEEIAADPQKAEHLKQVFNVLVAWNKGRLDSKLTLLETMLRKHIPEC